MAPEAPSPADKTMDPPVVTTDSMPVEVLDEILANLDLLDYYLAKISCRALPHTRGTLHEAKTELMDNSWKFYLAQVRQEGTNITAERLCCVGCQETHPCSEFHPSMIFRYGLERFCQHNDFALELGRARHFRNKIEYEKNEWTLIPRCTKDEGNNYSLRSSKQHLPRYRLIDWERKGYDAHQEFHGVLKQDEIVTVKGFLRLWGYPICHKDRSPE